MNNDFTLIATCLFGLEGILKNEIIKLGYNIEEVTDGRVSFKTDALGIARANVFLRTAQRVLLQIGKFKAQTFDELFENVKKLNIEDYIGPQNAFPVKGSSVKSKLFSIPDCQRIIKKSLVEKLSSVHGISHFDEDDEKIQIVFHIINDICYICIDTSGFPLHIRGYRKNENKAPIRETIASSLVYLSRFSPGIDFYDPMCGSGTIAIECAMMSQNIAPNKNSNFDFENFDFLPLDILSKARNEAQDNEKRIKEIFIHASDIDKNAIMISKSNAKNAKVFDNIMFDVKDVKDFKPLSGKGVIVTNPPYGERLMDIKKAIKVYNKMKSLLIADHRLYVIAPFSDDFEKAIGKRADKKRKIYNGKIKCNIYQYFKNA